MGKTGSIDAYVVNAEKFPFVVTEMWHDEKSAKPIMMEKTLLPQKPVKLTLEWTPPISDNPELWKPLKGGIHIKGYYIVE